MPQTTDRKQVARICKILSDPVRLDILFALYSEGRLVQKALVDKLRVPQPSMSRHLRALSGIGLVIGKRDGQFSSWSLGALPAPLHRFLLIFQRGTPE